MLCLHYQDPQERARALCSIGERCQEFGARLVFLGSETACETTRLALSQLESAARLDLQMRPLPPARPEAGAGFGVEVIRTALLELCSHDRPAVVWVEAPALPAGAAAEEALSAYCDALVGVTARDPVTVIHAFCQAEIPERAIGRLIRASTALISTKMLLPRCPEWLVDAPRGTSVPADPAFMPLLHAENLAALGQLAAGVAHELGNPLSIISSSLQYLHQRLADANDPAADFTSTALLSVERMHGLLRSMLDFAAWKEPRLEPIDLKDAVSEIVRFTSAEVLRHGIALEVSFDPSLPSVWVDPGGIKQILLNLIKNALEALLAGGEALRIRTRLSAEDRLAIVEVENNGPAIAADVLADLFRPFHTTKDGGTGLGLYLSRQIAKDHGGDLQAWNLSSGVRFTLTLPLDRRKEADHGARPRSR
jgi:signal transduction histidine kinase